ncbi:MAG: SRPBCC domain-containing protein [Chitinophagaceae bacterium]
MSNHSLFDFAVDKSTKTVTIDMEFDADPSLVWDAFTKAELLDQWYAPKPLVSKTKYMDFRVGGRRFYAMVTPDGQERWALQTYTAITPKTHFKLFNVFADKDENPDPYGSDWDLHFAAKDGKTIVHISIYNESLERLESVLEGFKTGMTMTYGNLKELLQTLSGK